MYGKDSKFTVVYNAVDIAPYLDVTPQEIRKREQEIGAKEEDIELMTDKLLKGRKTEGNYVKLNRDDVIAIYRSAL